MRTITYNIMNQKMHNHIKDVLNRYGGKIETITLGNISKDNIFFEDVVIITSFKGYLLFDGDPRTIEIESSYDYQDVSVTVWHDIGVLTEKYEGNLCEFNLAGILDKIIDKTKPKEKIKQETESETAPF